MEQTLPATPTLAPAELAIVTGAKLVQSIAYRIVYPLLPFLALNLNVELRTVGLLITIQVAASLLSPIGGTLSALTGQRTTMMLGMLLFVIGTAICGLSGSFAAFAVGYGLIGFAVALYHPAAQAYLSARTTYARRGWALGMYEVSWAAAAFLGIAPLMYLVGQTGSPQIVFVLLTAFACAALVAVWLLPPAHPSSARPEQIAWGSLRLPGVVPLLLLFLLVLWGVDLIFVVQSGWLNQEFGAEASAVGFVFALQGIAELLGSTGSALLVDRIGKKRSVFYGYGLMAAAALLLPFTVGQWLLFLPLFFLFDLGFEFGIVSSFPLASGVAPLARSTVLALCTVAVGLGRTLGSLVAEPVWATWGIGANAVLTAALTLGGLIVCWLFVHENEAE